MLTLSQFPTLPPPQWPSSPLKPSSQCTTTSKIATRPIQAQNPHLTIAKPSLIPTSSSLEEEHGCPLLNDWPHLLQISIGSGDFHLGLAVHAFLVKSASQFDIFQGNNLINMYSKFERLDDAQLMFDKMTVRNTVTWTTLINGYSQVEELGSVLRISCEMHCLGEKFNGHTCNVVLRACREPEDLILGEQVHGFIIKSAYDTNVYVGTSLVSLYMRSGFLESAEKVFNGMRDVDVRCLNSMILEYGKSGNNIKVIETFCNLRESGLEPDGYTFTNMISACDGEVGVQLGSQLHCFAIKYGTIRELPVANALITMYGTHGLVDEAEKVFNGMKERTLVSWTAIMSAYAKNHYHEKAIDWFVRMLDLRIGYDSSSLAIVVDACSGCKSMELASQVHGICVKFGYAGHICVGTAIVDAYAKCGHLSSARKIFNNLLNRNTVSFNAILSGYMQAGVLEEEEDALVWFNWMRVTGTKPHSITCMLLLSLSADQASIAKGKCLHAYAIRAGFEADINVGNAIISMYAKCGNIEDASQKFEEMVSRDSISWNAMISGYSLHGMGKEALLLLEKMEKEKFNPDEITLVSALQACSYSGLSEKGFCLFQNMETRYGVKPALEHHVCMVNLIGQAGDIPGAMEFVKGSEFRESPLLWRALVSVCKQYGDLNIGMHASEKLLHLLPDDASSHILVSNLYSEGGMWEEAAKVRLAMSNGKMMKEAGCSWIEIGGNGIQRFVASG